jgi:hypothetical protein
MRRPFLKKPGKPFSGNPDGHFAMKEPWGNISSSLEGFHYFNDFKKNHWFSDKSEPQTIPGFSISFSGVFQR